MSKRLATVMVPSSIALFSLDLRVLSAASSDPRGTYRGHRPPMPRCVFGPSGQSIFPAAP